MLNETVYPHLTEQRVLNGEKEVLLPLTRNEALCIANALNSEAADYSDAMDEGRLLREIGNPAIARPHELVILAYYSKGA